MPKPATNQRMIRQKLRSRWMTATELAGAIGTCPRSVGWSLRHMQKKGQVEKVEKQGRHDLWALKKTEETNPWMMLSGE